MIQNKIENKEIKIKRYPWKFAVIFVVINIGFILVLAKIFIIQVIDVDVYRKKAKFQHETKVNLKANRGDIYDRNGKIIAATIQSISIAIDPTIITEDVDRNDICDAITLVTGINKSILMDKIQKSTSSFVWLARGISPEKSNLLDSIKDRGFIRIFEPKRHYLYGSSGMQVIGTTDVDNNGNNGIELSCDSLMKGRSGFMIMNRDASGHLRPSLNLPKSTANDGKDITLTLDMDLQRICEYELMQGVKKAVAESGTVIAMDPKTGEILAFANYSPIANDSNIYQSLRIKGISDQFDPGSTFKLVTAASALEENLIKPTDIVDGGNGFLKVGDGEIKDDHPVGRVTFTEALAKSSNIVFGQLAARIPENDFYKYIRDFGFGLPLGIDLPGEAAGKILKPIELTPTMRLYVGHGYGISATPLQILSAYACVANDGVLMKPFLVKSSYDKQYGKKNEIKPTKIRSVISPETCKMLKDMLVEVVDNGTGQFAKINGLKIAGKTGTAQQLFKGSYDTKSYIASFAGFFPAYNPKVAMIVVLNKPQGDYYGGSTAAPVFKNITNSWLSTNSNLNKKSNLLNDSTKSFLPDLKGYDVQVANDILRHLNLRSNIDANSKGIVLSQLPYGNKYLTINDQVNLNYKYFPNETKKKVNYFDLKGLSLRKAISILHSEGFLVKVNGSGKVISQQWITKGKEIYCILECN